MTIDKPEEKGSLMEQLEVCENYINDVPNIFDPCGLCENWDEKTCYNEDCRECCWYYSSRFKLKGSVKKNCLNCRHWFEEHKLCQYSMGDKDYWCRLRNWERKEEKENESGRD